MRDIKCMQPAALHMPLTPPLMQGGSAHAGSQQETKRSPGPPVPSRRTCFEWSAPPFVWPQQGAAYLRGRLRLQADQRQRVESDKSWNSCMEWMCLSERPCVHVQNVEISWKAQEREGVHTGLSLGGGGSDRQQALHSKATEAPPLSSCVQPAMVMLPWSPSHPHNALPRRVTLTLSLACPAQPLPLF